MSRFLCVQASCACTILLCMHNTLVHALKGPGTKAWASAGGAAWVSTFLGPGLGPWLLQCMHKSVVHAQECCACTRILCMQKNLGPHNLISSRSVLTCFRPGILDVNKIIMCMYEKYVHLCVFPRKLLKYAPPQPPQPVAF